MKKHLKLIVVVAGFTLAIIGNIYESSARPRVGRCNSSNDDCGTSTGGQPICGTWTNS